MASDFALDLSNSMIEDLAYSREAYDLAQEVGDIVAGTAATRAPRESGAGANSIHAQTGADDESVYADVSWDRDHFYMYFSEVGTEHQPARPFLRPALDSTRI